MIPLSLAPKGGALTIGLIKGKDETKRFLENLGFVQGGSVTVITEIDGNMIVNVKDVRVAVSKQKANRILVEQ